VRCVGDLNRVEGETLVNRGEKGEQVSLPQRNNSDEESKTQDARSLSTCFFGNETRNHRLRGLQGYVGGTCLLTNADGPGNYPPTVEVPEYSHIGKARGGGLI